MAKCSTCHSTAIDGYHFCSDCLGAHVKKYEQRDAEALALLHEIWNRMDKLKCMLCVHCASGCPSACEQFTLHHRHISGSCDAWQFNLISEALDGLRDEHFNTQFNPDRERRTARTEAQRTGQGVCPVCETVKR